MFPLYLNYAEILDPNKTILYARKSRTDDPALTVEEVLEKHEIRIDEWTEQNLGANIPEKNRFREVVSGEKISERPEFNKVLRLIESPEYNAIICFDTARISRGDLEDAGRLIKLLRYTSTYVITVSPFEFYDLSLERDRDLFERALKRGNEYLEYFKKVSANGKDVSCSQGNFIASVPPYGYDKIRVIEGKKECPTLKINEEKATVVRLIFDLYVNQNMGICRIANYLDEMNIKPPKGGEHWCPDSITQILENITYIGKIKWNYKKTINVVENGEFVKKRPRAKKGDYQIFEGKHEPIISEELFEKAQKKKGKNYRAKPDTKIRNPFAGILQCQCGKAMVLRCNPAPLRLYCRYQSHCLTGSVQYNDMVEEICTVLEQKIEDFHIHLKNDDEDLTKIHAKMISNLEKKLKELEEKELAQWEQQSHPDPSQRMPAAIFKQLNERVLKEKEDTKHALQEARETMPVPVNYEEKICRFQNAIDALKNPEAPVELKNALLKSCFKKIIYSREHPERLKSQRVIYYDKVEKKTKGKSPLKVGGSWSEPPIFLEVIFND